MDTIVMEYTKEQRGQPLTAGSTKEVNEEAVLS